MSDLATEIEAGGGRDEAVALALEHYSPAIISRVYSKLPCRGRRGRDVGDKPEGFWVSVAGEDDWPSWCRAEDYSNTDLMVRHLVELAPGARIIRITDLHSFDAFEARYGTDDRSRTMIRWPDVGADGWQGIIIAPYLWERRFQDWYYGWDCASGVIWDAAAIALIRAVESEAHDGC